MGRSSTFYKLLLLLTPCCCQSGNLSTCHCHSLDLAHTQYLLCSLSLRVGRRQPTFVWQFRGDRLYSIYCVDCMSCAYYIVYDVLLLRISWVGCYTVNCRRLMLPEKSLNLAGPNCYLHCCMNTPTRTTTTACMPLLLPSHIITNFFHTYYKVYI